MAEDISYVRRNHYQEAFSWQLYDWLAFKERQYGVFVLGWRSRVYLRANCEVRPLWPGCRRAKNDYTVQIQRCRAPTVRSIEENWWLRWKLGTFTRWYRTASPFNWDESKKKSIWPQPWWSEEYSKGFAYRLAEAWSSRWGLFRSRQEIATKFLRQSKMLLICQWKLYRVEIAGYCDLQID